MKRHRDIGYLVRVRSDAWILDPLTGALILRPGQVVMGTILQKGVTDICVQISIAFVSYRFDPADPRISMEPILSA